MGSQKDEYLQLQKMLIKLGVKITKPIQIIMKSKPNIVSSCWRFGVPADVVVVRTTTSPLLRVS